MSFSFWDECARISKFEEGILSLQNHCVVCIVRTWIGLAHISMMNEICGVVHSIIALSYCQDKFGCVK